MVITNMHIWKTVLEKRNKTAFKTVKEFEDFENIDSPRKLRSKGGKYVSGQRFKKRQESVRSKRNRSSHSVSSGIKVRLRRIRTVFLEK